MKPFDLMHTPLRGRFLIEAGAGTGKTFSLEHLVLRLIVEEHVPIERILLVTFTNAATGEIRERVRALLFRAQRCQRTGDFSNEPTLQAFWQIWQAHNWDVGARIDAALDNFDDACVKTIHSFCEKILKDFVFTRAGAYEASYGNSDALKAQVIDEFLRSRMAHLDAGAAYALTQWTSLESILSKLASIGHIVDHVDWLDEAWKKFVEQVEKQQKTQPTFQVQDLRKVLLEFARWAPQRLAALEKERATMSFDSLLQQAHILVQEQPELVERIRALFDAVLIDEFQDTDPVQYGIFQTLFLPDQTDQGPATVVFVGDPKQAIYSFRSAELETYFMAKSDLCAHNPQAMLELTTNYRSCKALVHCVNAWFNAGSSQSHFLEPQLTMSPAQSGSNRLPLVRVHQGSIEPVAAMSVWVNPAQMCQKGHQWQADEACKTEAQWIARDIAGLLTGDVYLVQDGKPRAVRAGDIAILVRNRNKVTDIVHALQRHGVRCHVNQDKDVFQTDQALEILAVLRALVLVASRKRLDTARSTKFWGRSLKQLRDSTDTWTVQDKHYLRQALACWTRTGPTGSFRCLMRLLRTSERLLPEYGGQAALQCYEHVIELMQEQFVRLKTPAATLRWFEAQMADSKKTTNDETRKLRPSANDDVVHIETMHHSKGLEYPVVYVPLTHQLTVSSKSTESFFRTRDENDVLSVYLAPSPIGISKHKDSTDKQIQESIRLAYVAMTRASSRLVVSLLGGQSQWKVSYKHAVAQALFGCANPVEQIKAQTPEEARKQLFELLQQKQQTLTAAILGKDNIDPTLFGDNLTVSERFDALDSVMEIRDRSPDDITLIFAASEPENFTVKPRAALRTAWHRSSFTAIDKSLHTQGVAQEYEAEEDDEDIVNAQAIAPQATEVSAFEASQEVYLPFLRGADAGDWMHKLLQDYFQAGGQADRERLLTWLPARLQQTSFMQGTDETEQQETVAFVQNMLHNVAHTPLFQGLDANVQETRLIDIAAHCRINEMPFLMSVASTQLQTPQLIDRLRQCGLALPAASDESFGALHGYMTGAIDLVLLAGDKFWVIDWKSNCIGAGTPEYYTQKAMREQIAQRHYGLQYCIYLLALKRHLKHTFDWDDETAWEHIGGAVYVFLRGLHQQDVPGQTIRHGIFFDRPREAVDALDDILEG